MTGTVVQTRRHPIGARRAERPTIPPLIAGQILPGDRLFDVTHDPVCRNGRGADAWRAAKASPKHARAARTHPAPGAATPGPQPAGATPELVP